MASAQPNDTNDTPMEQSSSAEPSLPRFAGQSVEDIDMDTLPNETGGSSDPSEVNPVTEPSLLPEEMWLKIFQLLNRPSLSQARLVCRCWNRIIGNTTSLMNKYTIRVDGRTVSDRRKLFSEAIIASSSRYTTVRLEYIATKKVEDLGWWHSAWKKLGETIQSLRISDCRITTKMLLNMLKETPNLKTLDYVAYNNFTNFKGASVDFQLNQLSKLELMVDKHAETVNVFRKICPRLKQLHIYDPIDSSAHKEAVVALVKSVGHTLEELQFDATEDMLDKLCRIQLPHLKTLRLEGECHPLIPKGQIVRFIKSCSTIKTLDISYVEIRSAALLHDLTEHLPNLTRLMFRTWPDFAAKQACKFSFLRNLPHLEILDVTISDIYDYTRDPDDFPNYRHDLATLDLDGCESPSLKMLVLFKQIIPKNALQTLFSGSHNIKGIYLRKCRVQASDIVSIVSQLQSLEKLELYSVEVKLDNFTLSEHDANPSKLKTLNIFGSHGLMLCSELLITLLMRCPAIEKILFLSHDVEDSVLEVIHHNLVHLEELSLVSCRFSEERLAYLKANKSENLKKISADQGSPY